MGPGVYRKDGKVLGVSISNGEFSEYYNLGHYDCSTQERQKNKRYLKPILASAIPKVLGNGKYDIDWLENGEHNLKVGGQLHDIQVDEALINEHQGEYNNDFLAFKYLGKRKLTSEIDEFCAQNGLKGDSREWIFKMPYSLVRRYAIGDVEQPLAIHEKQTAILADQDLLELSKLENELARCILLFRKTGVRIDEDKRDRNALLLQNKMELQEQELFEQYGEFNYNSSRQVKRILDGLGIDFQYDLTEKGNAKIDDAFFKLYSNDSAFVKLIHDVKKTKRILNTFLLGAFTDYVTDDHMIHCLFHNTMTDDNGTVTGRFSSSNPNLQQAPTPDRDKFHGNLCREIFLPFEDCDWGKIDLSQIEYRIIAHFAVGPGSEELRQSYIRDPHTDYHNYIVLLTGLIRSLAKNLNFGCGFGMGAPKMSKYFGWKLDYCKELLRLYHQKAPYIRATMRAVSDVATSRGYIRTILKRRSRLLDRSKAYIMFNHLIQGTAADYIKMAMFKTWKAGIFDVLPPHLTVHDEIDVSIPHIKEGNEAFAEMKHIMETAIPLKVPVIAEAARGCDWAHVEKIKGGK